MKLLKFLISLFIALLLGIGSALLLIKRPPAGSWIMNGAWETNLAIGSRQAGIYPRAHIALTGLFALNKSETVYYSAYCDDNGDPLKTSCDYHIEGEELKSRWWSITAYGEDSFLIPNEQNIYSYNKNSVMRKAEGSYIIFLSSTPKDGNWLSVGKEGTFSLILRLYNPAPEIYLNPESITLPRIRKDKCK